ncbi:hypothetical protein BVC71_14220 [Marivivens niveibacter]|uniref:Uncharacterized protein n=1 Tax=Marivivens niveibacter TaxID=1930667 RepID=A0A251WWH6_9RHOB|nr:hypothetical protein [Marivivens niveibacter]OUD08323.1 hypothetical protein BVC71_14220 [Marivivens niveibacter]
MPIDIATILPLMKLTSDTPDAVRTSAMLNIMARNNPTVAAIANAQVVETASDLNAEKTTLSSEITVMKKREELLLSHVANKAKSELAKETLVKALDLAIKNAANNMTIDAALKQLASE